MSRAKPYFLPEPRIWTLRQVALRLGKSEGWFKDHRDTLEAMGFPLRDPALDGWDSAAIERWLDARAGLLDHLPNGDRELAAWVGSE